MCFPCSISIIASTENHAQLPISRFFSTLTCEFFVNDCYETPPSAYCCDIAYCYTFSDLFDEKKVIWMRFFLITWRSWFHDHFLGQIIKQTFWPQQLWMICVIYHLTGILLFIVWFLFQVISLGKMSPGSLHEPLTVLVSIQLPLFII